MYSTAINPQRSEAALNSKKTKRSRKTLPKLTSGMILKQIQPLKNEPDSLAPLVFWVTHHQ